MLQAINQIPLGSSRFFQGTNSINRGNNSAMIYVHSGLQCKRLPSGIWGWLTYTLYLDEVKFFSVGFFEKLENRFF
jgi:hypothetical protein